MPTSTTLSRRSLLGAAIAAGLAGCANLSNSVGYDIVVPIIQSNARGAATDFDAGGVDAYPDRVDVWDWSHRRVEPAVEPLPNLDEFSGMGIANTFVKDYIAHDLPSQRRVLIVNAGQGGTGFTVPGTNVKGPSYCWDRLAAGDQYNLARQTVQSLKQISAQVDGQSRFVAFLANHGSTDGTNRMDKEAFKAKLTDWIQWFRSELGASEVPYLMMQMRPDLVANENRHRRIDEGQAEVARDLASGRVMYATSPDGRGYFRDDSVHFNAAGVRDIGHRLYAAMHGQIG